MKHILGLDLGSASIGWAYVKESDSPDSNSEIVALGVRPVPLTSDESKNFTQGKAKTPNAERTSKRSARRNLQRYKQRREHLIQSLKRHGLIDDHTPLTEIGKGSTYETLTLRAKSAREKVTLEELARVLLAINKKRGYRSSRKINNAEDKGQIIDGMAIAKILYEREITPGQFAFELLSAGKRRLPEFYRSDLISEFSRIWEEQKKHHPDLLSDELMAELIGKPAKNTWAICHKAWEVKGIKIPGRRDEQKRTEYEWRAAAVDSPIDLEELTIVLQAVMRDINKSSGYLGAISDRSKELYFNRWTVGEYLLHSIRQNPHTPLKKQIFYRKDYDDEFEVIWETQSQYYPDVLTPELKEEIKDHTIFYQRKLKSQKHLISLCELERREVTVYDPETHEPVGTRIIGSRVAPKSSPLFQEFKIRQVLHYLRISSKSLKDHLQDPIELSEDERETLFDELNIKGNLKADRVLKILGYKPKEWKLNYTTVEGNRTNQALYDGYLQILELEGYDRNTILGIKNGKEDAGINDTDLPAIEIERQIRLIFRDLGIDTRILDFDARLNDEAYEHQPSYMLWHLLHSYEADDSASGNEHLYHLLHEKFGFTDAQAKIIGAITFTPDYGSLSTKAMRRIYPHLLSMEYSEACKAEKFNHSRRSITKEQNEARTLEDRLPILKKNSLRQPVVEKVLNQMINLVNALMEKYSTRDEEGRVIEPFHFDEIRIELARELKQSAAERHRTTTDIAEGTKRNESIIKILKSEFNIPSPSRNDIIRYRLYQELKDNGYKELYGNTYIPKDKLFSDFVDIDHIIPQAVLYNDSFSNKVLTTKSLNGDKSNATALDYIHDKHAEDLPQYLARVESLFERGAISKAKYQNLLKAKEDLMESGFIERDLRETQYIARLASEMLLRISRSVVPTTGKITDKLRKEWWLLNVMRELNLPKFKAYGQTEIISRKDGDIEVIKDWTKRNDHRHHAMDALTVAFTTRKHVQFFNTVHASTSSDESLDKIVDDAMRSNPTKRQLLEPPMPQFRAEAKKHLQSIIVSHKTKNKVVTRNKNMIKGQKEPQVTLTPRGLLHKDTVFGRRKKRMSKPTKLNKKFTLEQAELIIDPMVRGVILERIRRYNDDPTRAFDTKLMKKDPILLGNIPVTEVLCFEIIYTKRVDISPDLKVETVLDEGIKRILEQRLHKYGGDAKKAFGDLTHDPIWLNEEAQIDIKKVTVETTLQELVPLHYKHDVTGRQLKDENGLLIPTDYVNLRNNHHAALYVDEKGDVQEQIITFMEATDRAVSGLPIISHTLPEHPDWQFLFTIKTNELFVFPNQYTGFNPHEIDLLDPANKALISPNLYRVQTISTKDYWFRHHLESTLAMKISDLTYKRIQKLSSLKDIVKVRINHLGDIIHVGEY